MADPTFEAALRQAEADATKVAPSEFEQRLRMAEQQAVQSGVNAPPTEVSATPRMGLTQLEGRRDEAGGFIPIDQDSGLGQGYWRISQQSDPEAKAAVLQKLYPDRKVRILDTGDVTLEVLDGRTGKPKDVVINPTGLDSHDLLDLAASAPEIAAQIATVIATRGRGPLLRTAQIIGAAFAGSTVGKARDIASRTLEGIPVRGEDIQRQRNLEATFNVGAEAGLLGVGALGSKLITPFAAKAPKDSLAFNLREGTQFLRDKLGIDYRTTPGERTGSPALLAVEAAESPMPGARVVMDKLRAERNASIQEAQRIATGEVIPDEQLGQGIAAQLERRLVKPLEDAYDKARQVAIERGDKRVLGLLDQAIGKGTVTPKEAGVATREAFDRRVTRAKGMVDEAYAQVEALPGGTGDVLDGTAAATAAAEIRAELPAVVKQVEKPTGLVDELGQPVTRPVEDRELLTSGVPEGLLKALSDLENLRGGKVSLKTLTNMKKAAYDAIAAFKTAHGDVKDRWFTQIANAYESGIQAGVDATSDLELKNALANARMVYKREMVPLERPGLRELAKDEFDTGNLSPQQIASRFFEGAKANQYYDMLKETLGPNNPALRALKRAWVDSKLEMGKSDLFNTIDSQDFRSIIKSMKAHSPELAEEVFGKHTDELLKTLELNTYTKLVGGGSQQLDQNVVRSLLSLKDPSAKDLQDLIKMGQRRDTFYVNGILRDIRDGLGTGDFKPTEMVSRLRNANTPSSEVKTILDNISEETRQGLATAEFYRILQAGALKEGETAAKRFAGNPVNISPSKVIDALGTGDQRARTLLLLGEDLPAPGIAPPPVGVPPKIGKGGVAEGPTNRADVLLALVKTLAPKEASSTVFSNLGSLGSAAAVRQILTPMQYVPEYIKMRFLALAYTEPMGLGRALTNTLMGPDETAIAINTLLASEPFLMASEGAFGPDATHEMVAGIKKSLDTWVKEYYDRPAGRRAQATRQFLQGGQQPMRMEAQ